MIRPGLALRLVAPAKRFNSTAAATSGGQYNEFIAKRQAMKDHAHHTTQLWRRISFYVCIPGILVCALWTYRAEMAHKEHAAHADHEEERKVYSYMNIRNKPFPWGMQSLFFNPEVNIPAGDE